MATHSITEVARRAGVSLGTVSNVLNRPQIVAPDTRRRVQRAIEELGFVRNEAARRLRAGRSNTIGLLVLDVANPFFTDVARGVERLADEHGSTVMLCNSGEDSARERRYLDQLEELRVLGVLITPVEGISTRLEQLIDRGTPVVLVDRDNGENTCSVAVDNVLGGRLATEHLVERGSPADRLRRRSLLAPAGHRPARRRGGRDHRRHRADRLRHRVAHRGRGPARRRADRRDARSRPRPTAAFCANDLLALGLLQEMTRQHLRVPADIAIVGYDDIDFAAAAAVPLSSVRQPREQLGRTATELLLEEVQDQAGHEHRHVVFEPDLVIRESSS